MQQLTKDTLLHGGTYKIVKMLGQGSFGITYLAEHTSLGKKVAIKEFFMKELNSRGNDGSITGMTNGSLSYSYGQKFKKEALNLSRLDHPNIVRVTDSFEGNGTYYYVMDYVDGENLNDYLKHDQLSQDDAISIITSIAKALQYMHDTRHMLHLDLKPGNVMRRANDGHIFLIDFGLSKHFSNDGQPETSTTIGLGTPGYAPIEQSNQAKTGEFRPTIDVYALGATLFKLVSRETPPPASDIVSDDEIIENKLRIHGINRSIIDIVVNAMLPNVKKRTQNVKAFLECLDNLKNDSKKSHEETLVSGDNQQINKQNEEGEETQFIREKSESNSGELLSTKESQSTKSKRTRNILIGLVVAVVAVIAAVSMFTRENNLSTAKWDDKDSLAYYLGVAQSEGLREYMIAQLGVDTLCMDDFISGMEEGALEKTGNTPSEKNARDAYMRGVEVGKQVLQMAIGLGNEIYGDSTNVVRVNTSALLDGLTSGLKGIATISTEEAYELFNQKLEKSRDSAKGIVEEEKVEPLKEEPSNIVVPSESKETKAISENDKMMLGTHLFSLQWISWDRFGKVNITKGKDENTYYIIGKQDGRNCSDDEQGRINGDYVSIDGTLTVVSKTKLIFNGTIITKAYCVNNGQECVRNGQFHFESTSGRRYWRLQEMENPCDNVTDYVDIYFK